MQLTSVMITANFSESRDSILALHAMTRLTCSGDESGEGMIDTNVPLSGTRRNMIWAAKRVQRPLDRGNGKSVKPSRTELYHEWACTRDAEAEKYLFPELWSPTTTSWGRSTCSPTLQAIRRSILSRRWGSAKLFFSSGIARLCFRNSWGAIDEMDVLSVEVEREDK